MLGKRGKKTFSPFHFIWTLIVALLHINFAYLGESELLSLNPAYILLLLRLSLRQLANGCSDFASILGTSRSFRLLYVIKLRYMNKIRSDIISWFALKFQVIHTGVRFPYRYLLYIYEIYSYISILSYVMYGRGSVNVTISFFGFPFSEPRKQARHSFYLFAAQNKFLLDEWWDPLPPPPPNTATARSGWNE